jgi:hypothetical protein
MGDCPGCRTEDTLVSLLSGRCEWCTRLVLVRGELARIERDRANAPGIWMETEPAGVSAWAAILPVLAGLLALGIGIMLGFL